MPFSTVYAACFLVVLAAACYTWYSRFAYQSLNDVPGPPSPSWLYGNFPLIMRGESGKNEFEWVKRYGKVIKIKGPLGQNMLLISDPKALQYIYQTRGYAYPKHRERTVVSTGFMGKGLNTVDGDVHKRQRKVMLPGFGAPESKAFVPIFAATASRMIAKWQESSDMSEDGSVVVDIPSWSGRATLDAIGEAAFDYKFGAVDDPNNELSQAYQNMFFDTYAFPTNQQILAVTIAQFLPLRFLQWVVESAPIKRLQHLRHIVKISNDVARRLVAEKSTALLQGGGSRDVMSIVIKANTSEDSKARLEEHEMLAQLRTIILAGHETTSTSISWTFYELAKRPDIQERLRTEIKEMQRKKHVAGVDEWSWKDFEEMPYLNAVMKESLRFHAVTPFTFREALEDDVLPLSEPIVTDSGNAITELPIPKGVKILASVAAYNRDPTVFGADSDQFNPDRWLKGSNGRKPISVGVYANIMTFAAGLRACIGWRFAVLELQAFIVVMVSHFQFSHVIDPKLFRREVSGVMTPVIEGQVEKGSQLPLRITPISRE